jgi:cyclomaltodextrinase
MSEQNNASSVDWVKDAIFYQIFPDRFHNGNPANDPPGTEPWGNPPTRTNFFGGDLQGILDKLPYLQTLGINAIYLNPIFAAQTNHKYDTMDYLTIDPAFGDNALFTQFVREVHQGGLRIVLDGVFNHCGDSFFAFKDLKLRGEASSFKNWFLVRSFPVTEEPLSYYTCGGASYLPKLNLENPQVQDFINQVALSWLKGASIDGWRLDVPCKIPIPFWQKFRSGVKSVNPQAYLVGEIWRDAAPWVGGDVFDGVTNYALRDLIVGYSSTGFLDAEDFSYEVIHQLQDLGEAAFYMLNLLGSHDTPRSLTLFKGEVDRLLIAVAFLMTTVGAPLIYYGDEIGMTGETDPDCRRTMEWDELKWNKRIYNTYLKLIALRLNRICLRRGSFMPLLAYNRVFAYKRGYEEDQTIVILNPGSAVQSLSIPTQSRISRWYDVFRKKGIVAENGILNLATLNNTSFTILVSEK